MNAQNNADRAKEPRNKNGADATGTPERTPDAALAAARAALAALDKANTENASNRGELAAAWQALTALGEEHGGRDRGPRADEEWAVPVVDAPPTPPSVAEPPRPAPRERTASEAEWATPVIDVSPAEQAAQQSARRADASTEGPQGEAPRPGDSAAPAQGDAARAAAERTTRPARDRDSDGDWAAPVVDAPAAQRATELAPSEDATAGERPADDVDPSAHEAPSARGTGVGSGRPDGVDWAAPVLDGPAIPASGEATASAEQARDGVLFDARPAAAPRGAPDAGFAVSASFDVEPDESAVEAVREVLAAGGAPVRLAAQALGALGPEAADQLRDDPWNLLALSGISPQQADLFAQTALGGAADPDDPRRTRELIVWHLTRAAGEGHTAVDAAAVASVLGGFGVQDGLGAVRAAYENGRVMAFAERPEPVDEVEGFDEGADLDDDFEEEAPDLDDPFSGPSERVLVALERHALAEEGVAEAVVRLMSTAEASDGPAWPASPLGEALRAAGVVLYVTGAGEDPPAAPLALTRTVDARVAVAAATLDGRGRLAGVGVEGAVTVHGLIVGAEGPARSPDGLLDVDLLVVAEAHLLGPQTVEALLEAVPDAARVLLCGDPDELEPAGPGRVFADLRDSGLVPVVGSRERGAGVLGSLTEAVRAGSLPPVDSPDRQVVLVGARSAAEAVHRCVQLVGDSIPRALGIPADDVLVVTPAGGGSAGTSALNTALKERLNPGPGKYGGFDIGDRVVRAQGRDTGLLEGRVVEAVPDGLAVAYRDLPGDPVTVPRARLGELRHGWAVTVRQALGLRRPGIVAMLPGDAGALVTRALVYTAFTRAQRHLSIVYPAGGNLPQAVARTADGTRTTRLGAALRDAARESGLILH